MTVVTYEYLALQWLPERKRDHKFNVLTTLLIIGVLLVSLLISTVELPKKERSTRTVVPERVAKFILQKEKPKKIKPKPIPKPKIRLKPKRKKVTKKLNKKQKKARSKAADSGLLALGDELSDLIDTRSIRAMIGKKVTHSRLASKKASVNTSVLNDNVGEGSGGVSATDAPTIIGRTTLSRNERLAVRQTITSSNAPAGADRSRKRRYKGEGLRSEEEIAIVMDRNKSQLHSLYRRARRTNPGLKGKIVLAITISPSGQVSKIEIRSSELSNPRLESRLVARIKRFNFGVSGVENVTVIYPIEFLPS